MQDQSRVVCMWFGAFPCAFGLPSTVSVHGNQPLSRELQAVLCAQAWKPGSQHAGEKRGVAGLLLGTQKSPDTPGSPEGNTEGPGTASSEPLLPS